jgi:hypothetical protein
VTATLPEDVRRVFDSFITTELTTLDLRDRPVTWPVIPYHHVEAGCIDVTTGLGYPKKARDAERNPKVALLFSDPTGSGLPRPPMVLVQGTVRVDERDLEANRRRYERETALKLPATQGLLPPEVVRRSLFSWYFARIYLHVRPERVYVWPEGDTGREPELLDARMEEVRSGHSEEGEVREAPPEGGGAAWDPRVEQLGRHHPTAVVSWVAPDGFPFAVRVPVHAEPGARRVRLETAAIGAPLHHGPACVAAHAHDETFTYRENFQVRGDLVEDDTGWCVIPHRLVSGFERPRSRVHAYRANARKIWRFHRTARRELARRGR